jgi:hypothetical protein
MEPLLLIYHMSFVFSLKSKGMVMTPITAHMPVAERLNSSCGGQ